MLTDGNGGGSNEKDVDDDEEDGDDIDKDGADDIAETLRTEGKERLAVDGKGGGFASLLSRVDCDCGGDGAGGGGARGVGELLLSGPLEAGFLLSSSSI